MVKAVIYCPSGKENSDWQVTRFCGIVQMWIWQAVFWRWIDENDNGLNVFEMNQQQIDTWWATWEYEHQRHKDYLLIM